MYDIKRSKLNNIIIFIFLFIRLSFPSGHASMSIFFAVYICVSSCSSFSSLSSSLFASPPFSRRLSVTCPLQQSAPLAPHIQPLQQIYHYHIFSFSKIFFLLIYPTLPTFHLSLIHTDSVAFNNY